MMIQLFTIIFFGTIIELSSWVNPFFTGFLVDVVQGLVNVPFWGYWTSPFNGNYRWDTSWLGDVQWWHLMTHVVFNEIIIPSEGFRSSWFDVSDAWIPTGKRNSDTWDTLDIWNMTVGWWSDGHLPFFFITGYKLMGLYIHSINGVL